MYESGSLGSTFSLSKIGKRKRRREKIEEKNEAKKIGERDERKRKGLKREKTNLVRQVLEKDCFRKAQNCNECLY